MRIKRNRILFVAAAIVICGCSLKHAQQGLSLESAEEVNVLQEELVKLGFKRCGHSDGVMEKNGNTYAVTGYGFVGKYENVQTEVQFRIQSPPAGSNLPPLRSVVVHCQSRGDAEATSLRLLEVIKKRLQERMANKTSEPSVAPAPQVQR